MKHVEECFQYPPCVCESGPHYDNCSTRKKCICKELLSAGARGYKSGYDDAYWEGYEAGYDAALANGAVKPAKTYGEIQADFVIRQAEAITYFNQHGTGENP